MKTKLDDLFPRDLSDETAAVLCEVMHTLALICEGHYLAQLRRYHSQQRNLYDPEQPWRSPPRPK